MNCAGINLNPQNFTTGISSAPLQIVTEAQQLIVDGKDSFGIIKPLLIKRIKDFPSFNRERFEKILGHPIPDNSKENLSIEEKTELANLKEAMRIILANNSDKMQIFKNEEALKALWQVLTVEDSQNENIEQKIMVVCSDEMPYDREKLGSNALVPSVAGILCASYVINDIVGDLSE